MEYACLVQAQVFCSCNKRGTVCGKQNLLGNRGYFRQSLCSIEFCNKKKNKTKVGIETTEQNQDLSVLRAVSLRESNGGSECGSECSLLNFIHASWPLLILSPALKCWGPCRRQGLCSQSIHLWATAESVLLL